LGKNPVFIFIPPVILSSPFVTGELAHQIWDLLSIQTIFQIILVVITSLAASGAIFMLEEKHLFQCWEVPKVLQNSSKISPIVT
jgi:hypothetical protein